MELKQSKLTQIFLQTFLPRPLKLLTTNSPHTKTILVQLRIKPP